MHILHYDHILFITLLSIDSWPVKRNTLVSQQHHSYNCAVQLLDIENSGQDGGGGRYAQRIIPDNLVLLFLFADTCRSAMRMQ